MNFTIFAGTPATVTLDGTSFITTAPAAILTLFPILILPNTFAPQPIIGGRFSDHFLRAGWQGTGKRFLSHWNDVIVLDRRTVDFPFGRRAKPSSTSEASETMTLITF